MECKEVLVKSDVSADKRSEKVVIGAKVVQVSNNADVEAANRGAESGVRVVQQAQVAVAMSVGTDANLSTKSKFTEGPEIGIEQPSGPQNSKEEKKRKEAERRRRWLAALAGMAAGIKIMSMMPTPDPNENNRLPDKIPNIPTPQEKWFKWLWEKREMRFEYRPLEFIRAYADKYLEGGARSWLTMICYSQANFSKTRYYYSKDMKLTELSLLALITSSIHGPPACDKPVKRQATDIADSAGDTPSLPDTTTDSGAKSSDPKHTCPTYHSRLSDISTKVPSDEGASGDEAKFGPEAANASYNHLFTAENIQKLQEALQISEQKLQYSQQELAYQQLLTNLMTAYERIPQCTSSCKIAAAFYDNSKLLQFFVSDHKHNLVVFNSVLEQIANIGLKIIICGELSCAMMLPSGALYYIDFYRPGYLFDKFNDNITPADRQRNTLIKAALQNPSAELPAELTALGFSWFPKAETTKPITKPNLTGSTADHTGTSSIPSVASLTKELNSEKEKVVALSTELNAAKADNLAKDTIIANSETEIKHLKAANSALVERQQRCTCGAK